MINLPERFRNDLKSIIAILISHMNTNLKQIILFGSCARGEFTTGSDLDLLLITHTPIDSHKDRGEIRDLVDDYKVDLVFYNESLFETSDSLFVKNIKKDMIILWKEGVFLEQL